jgi:hypothetical protein
VLEVEHLFLRIDPGDTLAEAEADPVLLVVLRGADQQVVLPGRAGQIVGQAVAVVEVEKLVGDQRDPGVLVAPAQHVRRPVGRRAVADDDKMFRTHRFAPLVLLVIRPIIRRVIVSPIALTRPP